MLVVLLLMDHFTESNGDPENNESSIDQYRCVSITALYTTRT
jgi:hypothetical protein